MPILTGFIENNQPDVVQKAPDCFRKLEQANDRIFPTETRADRRILLAKYKVGSMDENTANQFMEGMSRNSLIRATEKLSPPRLNSSWY